MNSSRDGIIRILTVDDHPILRDGISAMLEVQQDMQLVGPQHSRQPGVALGGRQRAGRVLGNDSRASQPAEVPPERGGGAGDGPARVTPASSHSTVSTIARRALCCRWSTTRRAR